MSLSHQHLTWTHIKSLVTYVISLYKPPPPLSFTLTPTFILHSLRSPHLLSLFPSRIPATASSCSLCAVIHLSLCQNPPFTSSSRCAPLPIWCELSLEEVGGGWSEWWSESYTRGVCFNTRGDNRGDNGMDGEQGAEGEQRLNERLYVNKPFIPLSEGTTYRVRPGLGKSWNHFKFTF